MKKINKIVIVGGGSSGWMTAASLIKNLPHLEISVIESSDIPTVGVGESTLASVNDFLWQLGLKDEDWMKECNAVYKTSIDFTNFGGDGLRVRYPFGESTWMGKYNAFDWFIKKSLLGSRSDEYADFALGSGQLIRQNKLTKDDSNISNWNFERDTAYHIDAALFGKYLKYKYSIPRGVQHIDDKVIHVNQDHDGSISNLVTENNGEITADLFIDCTGFKSLLLDKTLHEPFESLSEVLINNKAIACRLPYVDKDIEMEHSTNATTLGNGWVWNTPLWDRIGTGYVYSDKFITEREAEREFREYLINDRDVPRPREMVEQFQMHHVDIKAGAFQRSWVKNVCAIGLSNGFIEPLESSGLHLIYRTIFSLIDSLKMKDCEINSYIKGIYNHRTTEHFIAWSAFIISHYAFAERNDTSYWKYISDEIDYINLPHNIPPLFKNVFHYTTDYWKKLDPYDGVPFIVAGFNANLVSFMWKSELYYTMTSEEKEKEDNNKKEYYIQMQRDIDNYNNAQKEYVKQLPSHYEFLKETIYKEQE